MKRNDNPQDRIRTPVSPLLHILDTLAVISIVASYWYIDIGFYAPQLISWWTPGTQILMGYAMGIVSGVWLFIRVRR